MDPLHLNTVKKDFKAKSTDKIESYTEIKSGYNNRLFKAVTKNQTFLIKVYIKDSKQRLYNEFEGFNFLKKNNFTEIPTCIYKNEELYYAVYSYEEGKTKNADSITKTDLDKTIDFIARLQEFNVSNVASTFYDFSHGKSTLNDYVIQIENYSRNFHKYKNSINLYGTENRLKRIIPNLDLLGYINQKLESILKGINKDCLQKEIDSTIICLSVKDFGGSNNTIFKPNGDLVFIDFEYFGWNYPLSTPIEFINHVKHNRMSIENKDYFIQQYTKKTKTPQSHIDLIDIPIKLSQLKWIGLILCWIIPPKIEKRSYSIHGFNEESYIKEKVSELEEYVDFVEQYNEMH